MARILVVEDSSTQALEIQFRLEEAGFEVDCARDGGEGFEAVGRVRPDAVLTDLDMPVMNGLELVAAIRERYPEVPVILMTALGGEEIAAQALLKGAAGYVPKRNLPRDIVDTLRGVLELRSAKPASLTIPSTWVKSEYHYVLENNTDLVSPLINHLLDKLSRGGFCDETALVRAGVALSEALTNAIHHGNLELDSSLREEDEAEFFRLAAERRLTAPYCDRKVRLIERETIDEVSYAIRDDGKGFDPSKLPDPTDPENMERASGRGLLLIRSFMDLVSHNETGNEITLVKRRERPAPPRSNQNSRR